MRRGVWLRLLRWAAAMDQMMKEIVVLLFLLESSGCENL
jgi:hypothetical protein